MTRRWWTVFNISIGIYMSTLDASIVNVSLPTIIQSLNTHGFITGLLIGGFFVEHLGWRSIFFVNLPIGVGSAAVLYLVFLIGDAISAQIFSFAKLEVSSMYRSREQASSLIIGILLFLWIGPAEEVFWRAFVQHRLSKRFGEIRGYLFSSLIYAGVHVWAFNLMLFLAALLCGLFWGALFKRYRSVWPGLISHAVWDVAIFVLFPIR